MYIPSQDFVVAFRILNWANENYDNGGSLIIEKMSLKDIKLKFKTLEEAKMYCSINKGDKNG